jgi:hypothetical protein
MATAMFAKTLDNFQHFDAVHPRKPKLYTELQPRKISGQEKNTAVGPMDEFTIFSYYCVIFFITLLSHNWHRSILCWCHLSRSFQFYRYYNQLVTKLLLLLLSLLLLLLLHPHLTIHLVMVGISWRFRELLPFVVQYVPTCEDCCLHTHRLENLKSYVPTCVCIYLICNITTWWIWTVSIE